MWIIGGILVFAAIVIALTFFFRPQSGIDYKELIEAKDETIRVLQAQRPIYERQIEELRNMISDHKKKDSLLVIQINQTKQSIRNVDERLKNIPANISRIADNNDSLRVAISNL